MIPEDIAKVTDPERALAISSAGLAQQHALDGWVQRVTNELRTIQAQNHIAQRMANLERSRRRWR